MSVLMQPRGAHTMTSPIDWQDCLDKANNKPDLAEELLQILTKDLPNFKRKIRQAYQQNNMDALCSQVHKLHGSCCYCGIPRLRKIVTTLENHLRTLPKAALETYMQTLNHEIDQVIGALNNKSYL